MESAPIVFIPGLLCTGDLFREQIASLEKQVPVMVADNSSDADLEALASRLLAAAPDRFALCGLSMGGYVALAVMRQAPERVSRLVLMDTSARPDTPQQTQHRRDLISRAEQGQLGEVADELRERILAAAARENPDLRRRLLRMAEAIGPAGFARQQQAIIARPDARPFLHSIGVPTLVIVGEEDALTPPDLAQEIAALIPGARLEIVAGAGHMSAMEQPRSVLALLENFLLPAS